VLLIKKLPKTAYLGELEKYYDNKIVEYKQNNLSNIENVKKNL